MKCLLNSKVNTTNYEAPSLPSFLDINILNKTKILILISYR